MRGFLGFLVLGVSSLFGQIAEIRNLKDVENFILPESFVMFDVDYTLTHSGEHAFRSKYLFQGDLFKKVRELGSEFSKGDWSFIFQLIAQDYGCELIESDTPVLIRDLQQRGNRVIAFTAADMEAIARGKEWRHEDLKALDVDFSYGAHQIAETYGFHKGVLFSSGESKGHCFKQFLSEMKFIPKHIIMVDDRKSHLEELEECCGEAGISFVGLHYTGAFHAPCDELVEGEVLKRYAALFEKVRGVLHSE